MKYLWWNTLKNSTTMHQLSLHSLQNNYIKPYVLFPCNCSDIVHHSCTSHAILGPLRARHSSAPSLVRCGPYLMLMKDYQWLCLQSSRLISTFVWTSGISSAIRGGFRVCWNFRLGSCVFNSSVLQSRIHIGDWCRHFYLYEPLAYPQQ
jgi:hypothetical protein